MFDIIWLKDQQNNNVWHHLTQGSAKQQCLTSFDSRICKTTMFDIIWLKDLQNNNVWHHLTQGSAKQQCLRKGQPWACTQRQCSDFKISPKCRKLAQLSKSWCYNHASFIWLMDLQKRKSEKSTALNLHMNLPSCVSVNEVLWAGGSCCRLMLGCPHHPRIVAVLGYPLQRSLLMLTLTASPWNCHCPKQSCWRRRDSACSVTWVVWRCWQCPTTVRVFGRGEE